MKIPASAVRLVFPLLFLAVASHRVEADGPAYTAIDLGLLPGGLNSSATAVNNLGQVVGGTTVLVEPHAYIRATLFDQTGNHEHNIDLGTLGGNESLAWDINNHGQIVGVANTDGEAAQRATLFDPAGNHANENLGTLGGNSVAYSINDHGQIVGQAAAEDSNISATHFHGFGDNAVDLGALGGNSSAAHSINASGQIVGSAQDGTSHYHAVRYDPDNSANNLSLGAATAAAYGINASGQIAGAILEGEHLHAALFTPDGETAYHAHDLGTLGGANSAAAAINHSGMIVGNADIEGNHGRGFIYIPITGTNGLMHNLNDLVQGHNPSDIANINIADGASSSINDWGQIAAQGTVDGKTHAVLLNPVNPFATIGMAGSNTKFVAGMTYAKFTEIAHVGGGHTVVNLLGGEAGSGGFVSFDNGGFGHNRDVTVAFTEAAHEGLASDVASLTGTFSDVIVLSLSYNHAPFGDHVALGWLNGGEWVLAVNGNTGENTPTFIDGAYDVEHHFHLGYYGIDADERTVWAVINHNSDFAAVSHDVLGIPEPRTALLLILAGAALLAFRRRAKGREQD